MICLLNFEMSQICFPLEQIFIIGAAKPENDDILLIVFLVSGMGYLFRYVIAPISSKKEKELGEKVGFLSYLILLIAAVLLLYYFVS
ncbi:MAG: hypothetical protein UDB11_02185 [Peptococcaceae bacterium]|nr:hypothetical protein [Peptococcaceae bacterium]